MSVLTDLQTARNQVAANIKNATANPKPSYNIDGQTVNWTAALKLWGEMLQTLNDQIAVEGGPVEYTSYGYTPDATE